jgi:sigma-B regulation protein RsbU (phosphoserine phosphatase)
VIAPPTPEDENERLAALRALELLDTPPEDRFDRVTRLLTQLFRVPMAFISLVDHDRQWFKASSGLTVLETPRSVSFCGHAILSDETFEVSDALLDERFRDNPMVMGEPFIRFYAGQPLHGPTGQKVGTLCIADRSPRSLDSNERRALRELGAIVERELGLIEVVTLQKELLEARARAAEAERERRRALEQLVESQRQLVRELDQASAYVRTLLPEPIGSGPVQTRWRFEPSSALGGDSFGYEWLDEDHFAAYLLDVSGHGVGAALLTVSVVNAIRARALGGVDFRDPGAVLRALNAAFPMERHDGKYFTIWYGVYRRSDRRLVFASAAHPSPLLTRPGAGPLELGDPDFGIGILPDVAYGAEEVEVPAGSRLDLFSDGVFEIEHSDGRMGTLDQLYLYLLNNKPDPDSLYEHVRRQAEPNDLPDDFSVLQLVFG